MGHLRGLRTTSVRRDLSCPAGLCGLFTRTASRAMRSRDKRWIADARFVRSPGPLLRRRGGVPRRLDVGAKQRGYAASSPCQLGDPVRRRAASAAVCRCASARSLTIAGFGRRPRSRHSWQRGDPSRQSTSATRPPHATQRWSQTVREAVETSSLPARPFASPVVPESSISADTPSTSRWSRKRARSLALDETVCLRVESARLAGREAGR